ncbi:hypothetical protein ACFPK1_26895 [Actinomycetospora rhizophila]|uniref:Uncharacterized protein n=1 Tax=Actinomycetospora rhizophila TaxID=1416876 RepID=A0ABV9ZKQ4_9PSEU
MDDDVRVTTMIVGLLIAFCALLLAKWLAVVAIAALVLLAVLRFALRRIVRAVRARREARASAAVPTTDGAGSSTGSGAVPAAGSGAGTARPRSRQVTGRAGRVGRGTGGSAPSPAVAGPPCSWCGLAGGHLDLHGRPVRPRHAHARALTRM